MTQPDRLLRSRLASHIRGGEAFSPIDTLTDKVAFARTGIAPDGLPYSFYQQFYHLRFAQHDILEYCRNKHYQEPVWPADYWPDRTAPVDEQQWKKLAADYFEERKEFCGLILDPTNDLFEPFASNPDHNLLRQAQLVIEHTAYHTGQLFIIYRLLNG